MCAGCLSVYRQWILFLSLGIRALRLYPFLDPAPDSLGITSRSGVDRDPFGIGSALRLLFTVYYWVQR